MQVRAGRPFSAQDGLEAQLAAIINEMVAQRYFANENPIGRRFLPVGWKDPITIVGVVGAAHAEFGLDGDQAGNAPGADRCGIGDWRARAP